MHMSDHMRIGDKEGKRGRVWWGGKLSYTKDNMKKLP